MSKVICECGYVIADNTDAIAQKARFIADQDFYAYLKEAERDYQTQAPFRSWSYFGSMFQCPVCGNLMLTSADGCQSYVFRPISPQQSKHITQSCRGDAK